jgi:hypothetical protein
VQTDSGKEGARRAGMAEAPDTIEDSAAFVAETVSRCSYYNSDRRRLTRGINIDRRCNSREYWRAISEFLWRGDRMVRVEESAIGRRRSLRYILTIRSSWSSISLKAPSTLSPLQLSIPNAGLREIAREKAASSSKYS